MGYFSIVKKIKVISVASLLLVAWLGMAKAEAVSEYDLKAAYLLNFTDYVEWPEPGHLSICVYGENPFKAETIATLLEAKAGQIDADFKYPNQVDKLAECNVLYLALSEHDNLGKITALLRGAPVLTVTDVQDGLRPGIMINLIVESNRLTFEVNLKAILAAKLKISSKMLKLAKSVQ
jgi:hypothetical protein